ncbi:hypothetical protein PG993_003803, partial [Apiospora rasikravindrae]
MCDIQIATGLGILTSAFILGPQCGLDAYHWQMIVHLAWFSAVTHLSGLFALRGCIAKRRWAKYTRVGLMFCLIVMLIVATVPTVFFNWTSILLRIDSGNSKFQLSAADPESAAMCFLHVNYGAWSYYNRTENTRYPHDKYAALHNTQKLQTTLFSVFMLLFGFTSRSVKLFGLLSRSFSMFVREPLSELGREILRKGARHRPKRYTDFWDDIFMRPALAVFITTRITTNLAGSMLAEAIIWGTFNLVGTRESIASDILQEENQWGFGQILSVLLLGGPLITTSSTIASDVYKYWHLLPSSSPRTSDTANPDSPDIYTSAQRNSSTEQSTAGILHQLDPLEASAIDLELLGTTEPEHDLSALPAHDELEFWLDRKSLWSSPWIPTCM